MKWWDGAMIFIFWMLSFKPAFLLLFHFHQEALQLLFTFCHKRGFICISKVIAISPGNLDSSLCFIQPAFHMMYPAYRLNKQGDNMEPWRTPFPIWNQFVVPCPVLIVSCWPAYRFLRKTGKVVWYSHLFKNFPVCCNPHSQKLWHSQ